MILPVSFLSVVLKLEIISVVFVFLLSLDPLLQILLIRSYDLSNFCAHCHHLNLHHL